MGPRPLQKITTFFTKADQLGSGDAIFRARPSRRVALSSLSRVRSGPYAVDLRHVVEGRATKLELARAVTGSLDLRYTLVFGAPSDAYAPLAEPIELRAGATTSSCFPTPTSAFPSRFTWRCAEASAADRRRGNRGMLLAMRLTSE